MTEQTNIRQSGTLFKQYTVPEIKTKHFDNSTEYVIEKKTRKGVVKVLKPEVVEEIKQRLESDL